MSAKSMVPRELKCTSVGMSVQCGPRTATSDGKTTGDMSFIRSNRGRNGTVDKGERIKGRKSQPLLLPPLSFLPYPFILFPPFAIASSINHQWEKDEYDVYTFVLRHDSKRQRAGGHGYPPRIC